MIDEKTKTMQRLLKLKALSECSTGNANEAAAAAAAMLRIMEEQQIEEAELQAAGETFAFEEAEARVFEDYHPYHTWKGALFAGILKVTNCDGWSQQSSWSQRQSRFMIVGIPSDIENARQLYSFSVREVENLARFFSGRSKVSYKIGVAHGILTSLHTEKASMEAQNSSNPTALAFLS